MVALQLNLCMNIQDNFIFELFFFIRYEVEHCSVIWAIKDEHISTTFFDEAAARFFLDRIPIVKEKQKLNEKRQKYETTDQISSSHICGGALGPDWAANRSMKGASSVSQYMSLNIFFII